MKKQEKIILPLAAWLMSLAGFSQELGNAGYMKDGIYRQLPVSLDIPDPVWFDLDGEDKKDRNKTVTRKTSGKYTAVFSITLTGKSATQAENMMVQKVNQVKNAMSPLGIYAGSVQAEFVSILPVYELPEKESEYMENVQRKQLGFQIRKNIEVTYLRKDLLEKVLSAAATVGVTELVKVEQIIMSEE